MAAQGDASAALARTLAALLAPLAPLPIPQQNNNFAPQDHFANLAMMSQPMLNSNPQNSYPNNGPSLENDAKLAQQRTSTV